ncbi:MAG: SAM-dependent methyltransferase [Lachnospiraceae bacterium]|nr:SAM-dependent methyltransferase [Lachnospiraceae bacterium]
MVKLSNRLLAVASFVTDGNILADVGTDHGYIPIYLLQEQRIHKAIAMDINAGPLERAKEHIAVYGLKDYIETRLSDGVAALTPGEVDTVLVAGMGGGLVMHILEDGKEVCRQAKELVLQPQSELERVREYLWSNGYVILEENMVLEDEKFYPMMRVAYQNVIDTKNAKNLLFCRYGKHLLEQKHSVLKEYLEREEKLYTGILGNLSQTAVSDKTKERIAEVEEVLRLNREAKTYF